MSSGGTDPLVAISCPKLGGIITAFAIPSPVEEPPMADYDSPWKEALDVFFEAFLELFFPQAHADIDWNRQ